jgi:alpha-glucosidase (family GH31 glycosyl hydrolase)
MRRLLPLLSVLGVACGSANGSAPDATDTGDAEVAADVPDAVDVEGTPPSLAWTIEENPLAIRLSLTGKPVTSLAGDGKPAFYLYDVDETKRVDLAGPVTTATDGGRTTLAASTEDGRKATVIVEHADEGAVRVTFSVEGKKPSELLGADLAVAADEGFYGLMERVVQGGQHESWAPGMTQALDLRGQTVELFVRPTVAVYSPFFVSSAGYGVWVESDWPGTYDFAAAAPGLVDLRYEGPDLALRVIPGPSPMDATARYARSIGTSLLPPKWAFGPWRWRDDHINLGAFYDGTPNTTPYNSMVVEDVLMMDALGIPCSVYWVDRPWGPGPFGYDDLEWDEDRLPHPKDMVAWLASRDIRFLLWIVDWAVGPKMLPEAEAKGYLTTAEFPSQPYGRLIDLTNPEAEAWWQDALGVRIADGLAGFKCDRGEEKEPDGLVVTGSYHDGTSFREGRNASPVWYARAVRGALERAGVAESVTLFRAAWAGSQRYTMVWAGDTSATEWGLRSAIIGVQRSAAMNFPLWGSDTCGYSGNLVHETCMRWLAFSAFTPLMEVGPTGDMAPWAWPEFGAEPYDEPLIAAWILYANLHDELRDYAYEQAQRAHEDGTMFVRPMIFAYPDHPEYRDLFDQYLFGPDLLVAPVWLNGVTQRDVHVPPGTWIDAWTRQAVDGPQVVTVDAPEHRQPIFVRDGSGIDLGDLDARWQAALAKAHVRPDLAKLAAGVK